MSNTIRIWNADGPEGGGSPQHIFPYTYTTTLTGQGAKFARFNVQRVDNVGIAGTSGGSGLPIPLLTAITGSTSNQTIDVGYTTYLSNGDWVIVDPDTADQEVVRVQNVVDSTHFEGIFLLSHTTSATILKVYSCYTKFIWPGVNFVTSFSDFGFIETVGRPPNAYSQFQIAGSYGVLAYTVNDAIPWDPGTTPIPMVPKYDASLLSATGNPTNKILIYAGPQTGSGAQYPVVRVQYLFTCVPEPSMSGVEYALVLDE